MENKDIVEALEQVPALVKAAETFKATSGHIVSSLANAVKQRPQAEIPESELQKISKTPCAQPDAASFSKALVQKVAEDIGSTIKEKVDEALKGATVAVQHTHSYCFERDLKEVADMRLTKRCLILGLTSLVLALIIAIIAIAHFNSDAYWGKQFNKVYTSPYLTEEEREIMQRNYHTVAILPTEYHNDPPKSKEQLRGTKAILKKRKREMKMKGS